MIFHDDIRLERIIANNGQPIIITSQPFINGVAATAAALDDLMLGKGYEKLTDGAYYSEREGLLVPPGDPAALAEAVCRLAADPHLRQELGAAARAHVLSPDENGLPRFSADAMIIQLEQLYGYSIPNHA